MHNYDTVYDEGKLPGGTMTTRTQNVIPTLEYALAQLLQHT